MKFDILPKFPTAIMVLTGFSLLQACSPNIFDELRDLCESDAELIVHDDAVWQEFVAAGERNFEERAKEYPTTERAFIEYGEGFDRGYGNELRDRPNTRDGEVVRNDTFITKDGEVIAQFVNYFARRDWAGSTIKSCVGNYPYTYEATEK